MKKMFLQAVCTMLTVVVFIEDTFASEADYQGSKPTKKYHFPWLVTFHWKTPLQSEFVGSGSIMTTKWVIGSMDCFVRPMRAPREGTVSPLPPTAFYHDIGNLEVHSVGIWGNPYEHWAKTPDAPWSQVRKVKEIVMFENPPAFGIAGHKTISFFPSQVPTPDTLNRIERSPFGFSMSVALVKVDEASGHGEGGWQWTRSVLPIPLISPKVQLVKTILTNEFKRFEDKPHALRCHVGGWRTGDWRIVDYEVVYVPLKQCQAIYCNFDGRACLTWPVNGTHVCFKSLTFTDPCWRDQGSALYCMQLADSVIGVLTSSPTCGYRGLPAVFTLIHHVLSLHEMTASDKYQPLSESDKLKYTPPPESNLFTIH